MHIEGSGAEFGTGSSPVADGMAAATRFFNLVLHLRRWDFHAETLLIRLAKHHKTAFSTGVYISSTGCLPSRMERRKLGPETVVASKVAQQSSIFSIVARVRGLTVNVSPPQAPIGSLKLALKNLIGPLGCDRGFPQLLLKICPVLFP